MLGFIDSVSLWLEKAEVFALLKEFSNAIQTLDLAICHNKANVKDYLHYY
jgi:hypothetical protein